MSRADAVAKLLEHLTAEELAVVGVAWFGRLAELAKVDPVGADKLAAAMFGHLASYRPESPAPLDSGFEPTEVERDPRGRP